MEIGRNLRVRTRSVPHIMLFDLYATGHHPQYILNLVEYWAERALDCRLTVVAPVGVRRASENLDRLFHQHRGDGLHFVPVRDHVPAPSSTASLIKTDLVHGRLLRQYLRMYRPSHATLMYFDHCQLSLALGLRRLRGISLSGIYFRPSFHLDERPDDLRSRLSAFRKKTMLLQALRNPYLRQLFCLDPFAVPALEQMTRTVQAIHLPDGVRISAGAVKKSGLRAGRREGRIVALLLGALDGRKGIYQVLRAAKRLEPEVQRSLSFVFAGPVKAQDESVLTDAITEVCTDTEVAVHLDVRYVPDDEVQSLVATSDVVLLPYQRDHVGSSNMLVRAALAGVPVLGTDHGLIGKLIRAHRLGVTVDSTDHDAVASGLRRFIKSPEQTSFDPQTAADFGRSHSAARMGQEFFSSVLGDL